MGWFLPVLGGVLGSLLGGGGSRTPARTTAFSGWSPEQQGLSGPVADYLKKRMTRSDLTGMERLGQQRVSSMFPTIQGMLGETETPAETASLYQEQVLPSVVSSLDKALRKTSESFVPGGTFYSTGAQTAREGVMGDVMKDYQAKMFGAIEGARGRNLERQLGLVGPLGQAATGTMEAGGLERALQTQALMQALQYLGIQPTEHVYEPERASPLESMLPGFASSLPFLGGGGGGWGGFLGNMFRGGGGIRRYSPPVPGTPTRRFA